MNKLLTEFIGTFFLVLTIALAVTFAGPITPIIIGCGLMALVYMGGPISGAHYNPAVTLAVFMRGKIKLEQAIPYVVVQLLGAFCGAAIAYHLSATHDPAGTTLGHLLIVAPAPAYTIMQALGAEILWTFALALVVLNVATVKQTAGNSYYGVAIGMTVAAGAACAGNISGGAFNPAVGVGSLLVAATKGASIAHAWLYIVGPCVGAAIAAIVFKIQHGTSAD